MSYSLAEGESLIGKDSVARDRGPRGETMELNKRAQVDRSYAAWVKEFDTVGGRERIIIRRHLRALSSLPLISIVLPVYNPDLALLACAIDSVRAQIYQNWQLCIADDASTNPGVALMLQKYAATDARIALTLRDHNGHIAACSNSALGLAAGQWIAQRERDACISGRVL